MFRLSIYIAALLHPRGPERTATFARTKKLYGLRSKAVHGEAISDERLLTATEGAFELLRALLLQCIDRGRVPTDAEIMQALLE